MARRRRQERRRRERARRGGLGTRHSVITGAAVAAGGLLGVAQPALADEFTVNSATDSGNGTCEDAMTGDCTLRDAIYDANADQNASYIGFASSVTGTVTLNGSIAIAYPAYIDGPGPDVLTIDGDHNDRIFTLDMDVDGDPVGIYGLTLANGFADRGGAIFDYNAALTIAGAALTGNTATLNGGALYSAGHGNNQGIDTGIYFTEITGNNAGQDGGGLFGYYSLGTIGTSTLSGNHASADDGIGGGASAGSPSFVYSSTIAGNSSYYAGGLAVLGGEGFLYNSIVANNTAPGQDNDLGHAFYAAFDLIRSPDTAYLDPPPMNAGPNILGQDPLLGPLQNNGGGTSTLRPAANSPVVDMGLSFDSPDQRGTDRPIDLPDRTNASGGDGGDIGSVELTAQEAAIASLPPSSPPSATQPKKKKKKCKKKKKRNHAAAAKKKCKKKKKKRAALATSSPWRIAAHRWEKSSRGHPAFRLGGDRSYGAGRR
jgi:CSLREA domain-containing protein